MKERRVLFAPEAAEDLGALYEWIAAQSTPDVALGYLERVQSFCARLGVGAERGRLRDDLRPGLRTLVFEGRLTLAYGVGDETVTVLRVFSAGRDWERLV